MDINDYTEILPGVYIPPNYPAHARERLTADMRRIRGMASLDTASLDTSARADILTTQHAATVGAALNPGDNVT